MIRGIPFDFGAETLVLPPLSLGDLEVLRERLEAFKGGFDKGSIATVIDATLAALKRNYPEMTRERVAALIDLGNMLEVMEALMDVAGVLRKKIESEAAPGEATAPSTGASSTPG